ncbi:MAG TPA: hypothetical protein EYP58_04215 [bacterium (Candidatus Stahlbacteria)]|nr:hypothetical protein [Candidatus Stahlbacteria bacterium]
MPNLLLASVSVFIGGWIGSGITMNSRLLMAAIAAVLAGAFGNIYNDIIDLPVDLKNVPKRPIPSGEVTVAQARILALATSSLAIIISIFLGLAGLSVVIIAILALFVYSRYLKKTVWANLSISLIASMSFLLGGIVMKGTHYLTIVPLSISYHFSRELIKDIIDIEGDKMYSSRSIPIIYGINRSKTIAIIAIVIFTLLLPLPYLFHTVSKFYLYISIILVPFNIYIIKLIKEGNHQLPEASRAFKFGMLIAILAVVFGLIL